MAEGFVSSDSARAWCRDEGRWLLAVTAGGFLLRLAAIASLDVTPESDEVAYRAIAWGVTSGQGVVDSLGNHAFYNVGYPLFVLAPLMAAFGDALLPARMANALLGTLSIVLCWAVARAAGAGKAGRVAAAGLWACYLPSTVYGVYLAKENLLIPLMLGVMLCALRPLSRRPLGDAVLCGVLFGLLALTGNAALVLAVVVAASLAFSGDALTRRLATAFVIVATAAAVATPWIVRNRRVVGRAVLNTNGGFNLYLGNNPSATGLFVSIRDTPRGPSWPTLRGEGEVRASDTLRREALAWIRENPHAFVALSLKKAALFWTPPVHDGTRRVSVAETVVRRLWLMQFLLLITAAVASWGVPSARTRQAGLLWLAIAAYTGVHMVFYVIFRYREPIMPLVCVLAALTVDGAWPRLRTLSPSMHR